MHEMNETERQIVAWLRHQKLWTAKEGFLTPQDIARAIQSGQYREIEGE